MLCSPPFCCGVMPVERSLPEHVSCLRTLVVVLFLPVELQRLKPEMGRGRTTSISSNKLASFSLICRRPLCSSSSPMVTVVVDKETGKSRRMELAVGSRAYHRWCQRIYGACSDRQPVFVIEPPILLAEGRPSFFLPAKLLDGRQCCFSAESVVCCRGGLDGPSGLVPGAGEICATREQLRTRSRFSSGIWGPLCILQGLGCNFCFTSGPVACCCVPSCNI